jgi:hypothetical protein
VDKLLIAGHHFVLFEYILESKFEGITKIVYSTEPKAVATGKPISEFINLSMENLEETYNNPERPETILIISCIVLPRAAVC